jgi:2-alkenal reductase
VYDPDRYSLTPTSESPRTAGRGWLWLGGIAFVLFMGALTVFATSSLLSGGGVSSRQTGGPRNQVIAQALPTPTPRPQVIIQPVPEGVDYETAVLTNIYEQVNPSVVNISVYARGASLHSEAIPGLDPDGFFPTSGGSGFVWDADGHIVTNNHVIEGADRIVVRFFDGTMAVADVVGADEDSDLAVIKVEPDGYALVPVLRGNLDEVRVGQRVAAIGNPFGLEGTLTSGIVSAIGRSIPARASFSIPASIQTDAPINPGNSGGPLLNERGEVIGVNAQIRSEERANSGVGFAIPISIVERVVPSLIADGRYAHPYIGISGATFSPICADQLGFDPALRGAIVVDVLRGTPAARAGLVGGNRELVSDYPDICPQRSGGDLIVAVNDMPVSSFDDVLSFLQRFTSPGDTVDFTVLRDGASLRIGVTLAQRPR